MKQLLFVVLVFVTFLSCSSDNDNKETPCGGTGSAPINLKLLFDDKTRVSLDSVKVFCEGLEITPVSDFNSQEFKIMQILGEYNLLPFNLDKDWVGSAGKDINYSGYLNGEKVVSGSVALKAGECFVYTDEKLPIIATISSEGYPCDEIFMSVLLKLQWDDATSVALDKYVVTVGSDSTDIAPIKNFNSEEYKLMQKAGIYALLDDSLQEQFMGKVNTVTFTGYIGNVEVVKDAFFVGADRCHVRYVGDKPLVITLKK